MKTLLLIGGLPGSGKTSLARSLYDASIVYPPTYFAADDYFEDADGNYLFDPAKLPQAHADCQRRTASAMKKGLPLVLVHNTFTNRWETSAYRELAKEHGYRCFFVTLGDGGQSLEELAERNTHGVPLESLQRMSKGDSVILTHGADPRPPWERKEN